MADTKRMTVNLAEDALAKLKWIADSQGITLTEALRRAIATEGYIRQEASKGHKILVQDPATNVVRELVFR
jgi:hypothetical protein